MTKHDTARDRAIGSLFAELRAAAEMSTSVAAEKAGFSNASLNRMENGIRPTSPEAAAALLTVYAVPKLERKRILTLVSSPLSSSWWSLLAAVRLTRQPILAIFEAQATKISHVNLARVPGLLQTPAYIRALMYANEGKTEASERRVEVRLARQEVLRKPRAPKYFAMLEEGALRRMHGGAEVMAEQIQHIADMTELPHVDVRVAPFDLERWDGSSGNYGLMEYRNAPTILHVDTTAVTFTDAPEHVEKFQTRLDTMRREALSSAESVKFLRRVALEYRRR
ncbi:helix-turn-helix domain-containing protein [Actinokineospora sp.]|uniref:helix-turn-helix domain-containing protein n=1 Tax=Actinokineospora sp. TaxID=1872133 RepID=UPI003D6A2D69